MHLLPVILRNIEQRFGVNFKCETVFTINIYSGGDHSMATNVIDTPVLSFECNDYDMLGGPVRNLAEKIKNHILQYANETVDVHVECGRSAVTSIQMTADLGQFGTLENFYACVNIKSNG
jgi:hypothetical protein